MQTSDSKWLGVAVIAALVAFFAAVYHSVVDARELPPEAKLYYEANEQKCRAHVLLLYGVQNAAIEYHLHDLALFKAALASSEVEARNHETVLAAAELYYAKADRPWVSHEEEERMPVEQLAQKVYSVCVTEVENRIDEYMRGLPADVQEDGSWS